MRRRYRILHLITRLELGGAQQNTLYCTAQHDRDRFEVHLVAGSGGILDEEALAIPDARVDLVPYLVHPIAPAKDLIALLRLRDLFRSRRIDLVHTHSSKAGILGRVAALLAGVPVIVHTVHGWSFNDTQPGWLRRLYVGLERAAATLSDRLIVVSSRNRDDGLAERVGRPEQYEVIHSGIDVERYAQSPRSRDDVRRELGYASEDLVVGTVGNFKPQKGPLDFVETAAAAYAMEPRLRFFMAGDGALRPSVEARIRELGLEGVVRLLGWRRDVPDLFAAMDVFLLTSLFEGLPRTVLQAMAAGVPVVATAVDGTPEVVEDGRTGLLTPPGDPGAAAEKVLTIVRDEVLRKRCVDGGLQKLNGSFEIRQMVRDVERVYLGHLGGRAIRRSGPAPALGGSRNR